MDQLADASQEDAQLFPDVAFTFHSWMTETLSMKENTTKNYCNQLRVLFEEDGKSFPDMATQGYFKLVRDSPVNRRGNNQRSACVKKFMEFWSAKGGRLWSEKGGWVKAPPNVYQYTLKGPIGTGRSDGEGASGFTPPRPTPGHAPAAPAPAQSAEKCSPGKESPDAAASRAAAEPAATASGAGSSGGASGSSQKPPPAAKPSEWPEASPEDKRDLPDLLARFRKWIEARKSDEVASATAKSFGDLFKKHPKPLAVMGSNEFVGWLKSLGRTKPGQMSLKSAMWFGHFWAEGLGRKLEGTLCEVPDLRPGAASEAPPAVGAAPEPLQGGKRRRDDRASDRDAKRRRELVEELLARPEEDPPAVQSDTEYAAGGAERFAKVLIVEASGRPKIDGPYRRYRGLSRGRPCYSKVLEHSSLFLYWTRGMWRIGKDFGSVSCMAKVKDVDGRDVVLPSSAYPHVWKVFQNSGDSQGADGKKTSARPVPLMRIFDSAAEDELSSRSPLARLPALREPSGLPGKEKASGSAGNKASAGASAAAAAAGAQGVSAAPGAAGQHASADSSADSDSDSSVQGGSTSSNQDSDEESSGSSSESGNEGAKAEGGAATGSSAPNGGGTGAATGGPAAEQDFQNHFESNLERQCKDLAAKVAQLNSFVTGWTPVTWYNGPVYKKFALSHEQMLGVVRRIANKYGVTLSALEAAQPAAAQPAAKGKAKPKPKPPPGPPPKPKPPPGPPPPGVLAKAGKKPKPPPGAPPPQKKRQAEEEDDDEEFSPQTPPEEPAQEDPFEAAKRFSPTDHRTAVPKRTALRHRGQARRAPRARITYVDGLVRGDEKGPGLELKLDVRCHRVTPELWFQQPGVRVNCDRCDRLWPQSGGMMAGAPGGSQFAQSQFWCNECAATPEP